MDMFTANFMTEQRATTPFSPPRKPSKSRISSSPRLLWSHCFPSESGAHATSCASSKTGVSVSPSPIELLWSKVAGVRSQMSVSGGSSSWCQTHRLGRPKVGLRAHSHEKISVMELFSSFWVLQMYGIWLDHKCAPPITLWFLVFGCRVPFWKVSVFYLCV